jgi:hypothetical protein
MYLAQGTQPRQPRADDAGTAPTHLGDSPRPAAAQIRRRRPRRRGWVKARASRPDSQGVSRAYTKATPACTNEWSAHGLPNWIHVTLRLPAVTWGLSAAPAGPAPPLAAPQPRSCSRTASQPILDSPRQLQERGRPVGPSSSTPWCATAYAAAGALVGCVPSAGDGQTRCHGQTVTRGGGMADLLRSAKSPILPNHPRSDQWRAILRDSQLNMR